MSATALSGEEVLAWVEKTATNWREFVSENPAVLALPCDIYKTTKTVAGLLHHIAVVELRYAQRLSDLPESSYEEVPGDTAEAIYATHDRAMALLRERFADPDYDWEKELEFNTITLGPLAASRRTILFHELLHSIRHYAQLGTLVREHGFKTNFVTDYLMMGARRA